MKKNINFFRDIYLKLSKNTLEKTIKNSTKVFINRNDFF